MLFHCWSQSRWGHWSTQRHTLKSQTGAKTICWVHFTALSFSPALCTFTSHLIGMAEPNAVMRFTYAPPVEIKKSSVRCRQHQRLSPSLPPSTLYSSLNLGSPQTTHHRHVCLWMGDESRWPCLWFWGSSSSRLYAAAWGWAAWDCWYWVERRAPGTIHQKGVVCTVGIDMNNPCFLYPFLCYYAYPVKFSLAFSSNIRLLSL